MRAPSENLLQTSGRTDLVLIADLIEPGSRVLDVGCGDGTLLQMLTNIKDVDARGVELSQTGVNACVARGLSVVQGDADADLPAYPDQAFDYVILSQTIQATRKPKSVLDELLRIGRRVIVSFPNFGYWKVRLHLMMSGRMPMTDLLDQPWYETPNIHLCTIRDFVTMCEGMNVKIENAYARRGNRIKMRFSKPGMLANLISDEAIFILSRPD
ncbi:MAG: methionine biosynthesis protein MetW [Alphaproteobacteria bacterium]|nr:MAG: methionine biosynthesis protein MetW [Alphaproteobacteria bacterium]